MTGKKQEEGIVREFGMDTNLHTIVFKMDNQLGPTVLHRAPCSVLCDTWMGGEWLSPFAIHLKLSQNC